eukprot:GSChrysophyteH1.ASY1.ANO1.1431.1 assembled CDS
MHKPGGTPSGSPWVMRSFQIFLLMLVVSISFFAFNSMDASEDGTASRSVSVEGVAQNKDQLRVISGPGAKVKLPFGLHDGKDSSTLRTPRLIASREKITVSKKSKGQVSSETTSSQFTRQQKSKYAYVTLVSGIDTSGRYRGFLYNALIMKKALADAGSKADFIAMVGFKDEARDPFADDLKLLTDSGIIVYELPRWVHEDHTLSFAEMALLKVTPFSFTHYDKVQFFDGDVMPTKNMDCLFKLKYNSFTAGAVSALNSGWYLGIPDMEAYEYMKKKAIWRLSRDWDKNVGWGERMPDGLVTRGGSPASKLWDFNGSDMDQGLMLHYHVINHGQALLIDTNTGLTRVYEAPGGLSAKPGRVVKTEVALECCKGVAPNPTSMFAHFTGRGKPWMLNDDSEKATKERTQRLKNRDVRRWFSILDSLHLAGVNSKTIGGLHLGSPLGFWNHNFPKGGFNLQDKHAHLAEGNT